MIESSSARPGELDEIVARLVATFQPMRIYLFGSRARGDARPDSDYDFLVEIDKPPEGITITRQGMTWLEAFEETEVQVHLRSPGALELRQNDPGRIDWDVAREGKLVYSAGGRPASASVPARKLVREASGEPPDSLEDWVAHAERDLRLAVHLSSDFAEWKEGICFNSQQAAEKFLKALIISKHRHPARTHKLRVLLAHVRKIGMALDDLDEDCSFLTPFAVEVRYPGEGERKRLATSGDTFWMARPREMTEAEARRALPAAERIAAAVRSHLP